MCVCGRDGMTYGIENEQSNCLSPLSAIIYKRIKYEKYAQCLIFGRKSTHTKTLTDTKLKLLPQCYKSFIPKSK